MNSTSPAVSNDGHDSAVASTRRRNRIIAALLLLLLLVGWISDRDVSQLPEPPEPLLVPSDLARQFDETGIIEFCQQRIREVDYDGVMRGAYGTLWAGEGNAIDRVLLAAVALEAEGRDVRIIPGDKPQVCFSFTEKGSWVASDLTADRVTMLPEGLPEDAVTPDEFSKRLGPYHGIEASIELKRDGDESHLVRCEPPLWLEDVLHQPVLLKAVEAGGDVEYQLNVGDHVGLSTGPLAEIQRATLQLTWKFRDETRTWRRELFDRRSSDPAIPGHDQPRAGDRYAIAIAAGPLVPEVLHTRGRMMELAGFTPVADSTERLLINLATKYQVDSDERTRALSEELEVVPGWLIPRITIVASEQGRDERQPSAEPGDAPLSGLSIDLLADEVEVSGEDAREFHVARGLANDLIETRVIFETTQMPVISASTVLSRFRSTLPDTAARRISAIEAELKQLLQTEPNGSRIVIRAEAMSAIKSSTGDAEASLVIERAAEGLILVGAENRNASAAQADWSDFRLTDSSERLAAGRNVNEIARLSDFLISRASGRADWLLMIETDSAWPRGPLSLANGSVLVYRIQRGEREDRIAVTLAPADGVVSGTWSDLDVTQNRQGFLKPAADEVLSWQDNVPTLNQLVAIDSDNSEPTNPCSVRIGNRDVTVPARKAGAATFPADSRIPLLLSWHEGDTRLDLEMVSSIIRGRVVDSRTSAPVSDAVISRRDSSQVTTTGADGRFAVTIAPPLFRRVMLLLDRSGSMAFELKSGKQFGPNREPIPEERQRMHAVHKAVRRLLDQIPEGLPVSLRSYTGPDPNVRNPLYNACRPEGQVTIHQDFTTDLTAVREKIAEVVPWGATPLSGAVTSTVRELNSGPEWQQTMVILLADGENSCRQTTAAEAWSDAEGRSPFHTIGFAIRPGSNAEEQLRELAEISGATFQIATTEEELSFAFDAFGRELAKVKLTIESSCHQDEQVAVPLNNTTDEIGIRLTERCRSCDECDQPELIKITADTLAELHRCEGLSPKAHEWIRERVAGGEWMVTIPSRRTPVGSVTAYGWFETELATGRLIGRTEDGLHGAIADPHSWPIVDNVSAKIPLVAWAEGITAYTAGAVQGGLSWHRQPGFLSGSAEDFKRFVQVNGLGFASSWWNEVGSSAYGDNLNAYWAGVCLNFTMQASSFGTPSDACHRRWAEELCRQIVQSLAEAGEEATDEEIRKLLESRYGKEIGELTHSAAKRDFADLITAIKERWDNLFQEGFDCSRFQR